MLIHMGWVGSQPPANVLAAVEATRKASPGCEVMFHADESMVPEKWLAVSRQLRPQMRSDIQRHCILRQYGGLWLDADVRVLRDPAEWTAGWDRYTAIRVARGRGVVGTDIIYAPPGWGGWDIVEPYMDRVIEQIAATRRVKIFALASSMIEACENERPEAFSILEHGTMFPFDRSLFSTASVVARGFDPRLVASKPARPGLGDMVKAGFSAVGITEERVSKAIGRPCGCSKRAAKLNKLGTYLGLPPGSTAAAD